MKDPVNDLAWNSFEVIWIGLYRKAHRGKFDLEVQEENENQQLLSVCQNAYSVSLKRKVVVLVCVPEILSAPPPIS